MTIVVVSGAPTDPALLREIARRAGGGTIVVVDHPVDIEAAAASAHDLLLEEMSRPLALDIPLMPDLRRETKARLKVDHGAPTAGPNWKRARHHPVSPEVRQGASVSVSDDERRQEAFDEALDRIRREGAEAFAAGLGRDDNPYLRHPQPHFANAWAGGRAEAALGIDLDGPGFGSGGPSGP